MAVDDGYTKCLLHFDGADASTTFTDEAGHTWTANGNAQIDTAQSKFGGASGLFDGTGDYISAPDSYDWRLDDGDDASGWTIDFWVRFATTPGTENQVFVAQYADGNNHWRLRYLNGTLSFYLRAGGSITVTISNNWTPSADTWYHVAVVKDGANGYMMFVDGTQIGSTQTDVSTMPDMSGGLVIGVRGGDTDWAFNGWLDELRISKGVARWTSNFTPMDGPYGAQHFQAVVIG